MNWLSKLLMSDFQLQILFKIAFARGVSIIIYLVKYPMEEDKANKPIVLSQREKNKISAKDFIKMKRGQAKEVKANTDIFEQIRTLILSNQHQQFGKTIQSQKYDLILTFLFTQNQLKKTPLLQILESETCYEFMSQLNEWCSNNSELMDREIKPCNNELKQKDWSQKYQLFNKAAVIKINQLLEQDKPVNAMIQQLGKKDGLYYKLAKQYMQIEQIILMLNSFKTKHNLLKQIYLHLLQDTQLGQANENTKLITQQVHAEYTIQMKNKIWKQNNFIALVQFMSEGTLSSLRLEQLEYNFFHELAIKDQKQFLQIVELIPNKMEESQALGQQLSKMLLEFDRSCESPIDKCLRTWKFSSIQKLLQFSDKIDDLVMSTNCLNKILANKHLKQKQKEQLINECIDGSISTKGVVKNMPEFKAKRLNMLKNKKNKVLQINMLKSTFSFCYDKLAIKTQKDSANSYPLVTYLSLYKHNSNLKTVQQLFLQALSKKEIKRMLKLIMKNCHQQITKYPRNSNGHKDIEFLYDYYQPFWKIICGLQHGDVMQYLLGKSHVNTYEIKMVESGQQMQFQFVCDHFLRFYIQNTPFLGEDSINKQIVQSIIECKSSERSINEYQLQFQLIKSLNNLPKLHTSKEYLITTIKDKLKAKVQQLTKEELMKPIKVWGNATLLDILAIPLGNKKPSICSIQEIIQKCTQNSLIEYAQSNNGQHFTSDVKRALKVKHIETDQQEVDHFWSNAMQHLGKLQKQYFFKHRKSGILQQLRTWMLNHMTEKHTAFTGYPQFKHGYFRLSHKQEHLSQKMQWVLLAGLEPYFSMYAKGTVRGDEQLWKDLMQRMVDENISWITALITEQKNMFSELQWFFHDILNEEDYKLKLKVINRILKMDQVDPKLKYYKNHFRFLTTTKKIVNLNFIIDLVKFVNGTEGAGKIAMMTVIQRIFNQNIDLYLLELTDIENIIKRTKQNKQLLAKLEEKKIELTNYFKKFVPIILNLGLEQGVTHDQIKANVLIPIIFKNQDRKLDVYCNELLKTIDLHLIFTSFLALSKIAIMSSPQTEFLTILNSLNQQKYFAWIDLFTHSLHRHRFIQTISKFNYPQQIDIIKSVSAKIKEKQANIIKLEQEKMDINTEKGKLTSLYSMIHILYRSISVDNKIEALIFLRSDNKIRQHFMNKFRKMIFSVENVEHTTAGLILTEQAQKYDSKYNKYCFYLRQSNGKVKKYSSVTLASSCSDQTFQIYFKNIVKLHDRFPVDFGQHLRTIVSSLVQSQHWSRLEKLLTIKPLQIRLVSLIFDNLRLTSNRRIKIQNQQVRGMIDTLFKIFTASKMKSTEDLFISAYFANYSKAVQCMMPKEMNLQYGIIKCLRQHPEAAPYFLKAAVKIDPNQLPHLPVVAKIIKRWLPIVAHDSKQLATSAWLVDEIRYQNLLFKQLKQMCKDLINPNAIKVFDVLSNQIELLPFRNQLYEQEQFIKNICKGILKNNQCTSLKPYQKYIPNLKELFKIHLFSNQNKSKKGACINLSAINQTLLKQLIVNNYLFCNQQKTTYSTLMRIIQTGEISIIQLFLNTTKLQLSFEYLKGIEKHYPFTFSSFLFQICNEPFLIKFINQYNILEVLTIQECSESLLMSICTHRFNKLMQFTIKWVTDKFKCKPTFIGELTDDKPKIRQNGFFQLPVQRSIAFNYYQCYFLIKQRLHQCARFKLSHRFISGANPQEWNYLPQLKRRVELYQSLTQTIKQAENISFRQNVLLQNIFLLEYKQGAHYDLKTYKGSLCRFICDLTDGQLEHVQSQNGVFQRLYLMMTSIHVTNIPIKELQSKYPSQMKIMTKLQSYFPQQKREIELERLFQCAPEFKPYLLIYNPQTFLNSTDYVSEMLGQRDKLVNFTVYMNGILINFKQFQLKHRDILQKYINKYLFDEQFKLDNVAGSYYLKRLSLQLVLLEIGQSNRQFNDCFIFKLMKTKGYWDCQSYEGTLIAMASHLNNRGDNQMSFDLMLWNKIITEIQQIETYWIQLKKSHLKNIQVNGPLKESIINQYVEAVSKRQTRCQLVNLKDIITDILEGQLNLNKKGVFFQISMLMNSCLIQHQLTQFKQKLTQLKGADKLTSITIKLQKKDSNWVKFINDHQLQISIGYSLVKHQSNQLQVIHISIQQVLEQLHYQLYFIQLQSHSEIEQLNNYCAKAERHSFFHNYKFIIDLASFRALKDVKILENILQFNPVVTEGVVLRAMNAFDRMQEKIQGSKNIKLYSSSDIFGPINFAEEMDNHKIKDCLSFYQMLQLPKNQPVTVRYITEPQNLAKINRRTLNHIISYLDYYIASSKEQNSQSIEIDNHIQVYMRKTKDNQARIEIDWSMFGAWSVCQLMCLVLNYCSETSNKIQKILDVRLSYLSLINYYEAYLDLGGQLSLKTAIQSLLSQQQMSQLIETILLMITEDVRNIMKIVKGIILSLSVNTSKNKKANVIISTNVSAVSVEYSVKDQLLYIIIGLKMDKNLNKQGQKGDQVLSLVSRKQFLDSVFISAQFLTDYFLVKHDLNQQCLNLSTSITKKLNTTINFHIQFSNLYKYIDEMRKATPIKDIQMLLSRLKQYLISAMDRSVNLYLSSAQLANKHQVLLINKCEAINRGKQLQQINSLTTLNYQSHQVEGQLGLKQIDGLMNEVGNTESLKNTFLIQIFKSYYTTLVGEGMTFVVGYKSSKKKAQVITITKAENINEINVIELDFILLVTKTLPSNDQLNNSKIIRIFVTDYNKMLYKINQKLQKYLLALPEESENRRIADFAPIIPSNIKMQFYANGMPHEPDTKDTKIFYIELNPQMKMKLFPQPDKQLTPINVLKRSHQFKTAIKLIRNGLQNYSKQNIQIIIDPPQHPIENGLSINYAHIIHLVAMDVLELISKFQHEPMRTESIDCKLSIEKGLSLNQNGVVQLRKLCFLSNFRKLRIRLRDEQSRVTFEKDQIVLNISVVKINALPSSSDYLSAILQRLIEVQKANLPKQVSTKLLLKNQSSQILLKYVDIITLVRLQIEQLVMAIELINLMFKIRLYGYSIVIDSKKAEVVFDSKINIIFNVQSTERQFYSAEMILILYMKNVFPKHDVLEDSLLSYYSPITNDIVVEQTEIDKFKIMYQDQSQTWNIKTVQTEKEGKNVKIDFFIALDKPSKYILVDQNNSVVLFNYFIKTKASNNIIANKNEAGLIDKQQYLYLKSPTPINLNFTNITFTKRDPLNKDQSTNYNLLHPDLRKSVNVSLASRNVYFLTIKLAQSTLFHIHYGTSSNLFGQGFDSTLLTVSSEGEVSLNNTKFVELQPWKKKAVIMKEKQSDSNHLDFKQISELASKQLIDIKQSDKNNIQNLVYVVNDECKKFLTRAGQLRIDYILLCDSNNNPLDYNKQLDIFFLHINKLALIRPIIKRRNLQFGLEWTPVIRGHYYLYINNVRMNPTYEIGVCAAEADFLKSKVDPPKVHKICYCQQSELMFDLRDSFGNIYSQLQQQIIGDELLIDIELSKMKNFLKMDKSQINKYGLKKIKFHINNTEGMGCQEIDVTVFLNCVKVSEFKLMVQGYSLKQRKKLLDGEIANKDKRYYKEITVNRNKFLEDLFVVAEKNMHTTLTVRFVGEPGIDAGGVKREFYDLIGNQMKNQNNPFFKLINKNRMEYFFNPDILKNKKKLQYMELWGKYMANSFLNSYLVGISFSPVFIKLLYDHPITYEDLLDVLPEQQRKQYEYLLTAPPQQFEDLGLYFTVVVDKKKCAEVELKPEGKDIQVTSVNVKEYLQLTAQALITNRYKQLIEAFKKGFESVLQLAIFIKWIRPNQFWCLTAGNKQLTPELVLNYINFSGMGIQNISGWFRRYISESNTQVLTGFLKFSSGSSSIDFSMNNKITVTFQNAGENPKKLPISHTCWKQIVVPKYKSYDIMKKLLNAAFIYCSQGFGFG